MSAGSATYRPAPAAAETAGGPRPPLAVYSSPGEDAGDGAGVGTLVNRLTYHAGLIFAVGTLLAAPAAAAVWYFFPPKYSTYSLLHVSPLPLGTGLGEDAPLDRNTFVSYLKTQATLLRKNTVLTAALRDPAVANLPTLKRHEDPVRWLEEELKVESHPDSQLIQPTLEGDIPGDLAVIVNAVQDSFIREVVTEEQRRKQDKLTMLEGFRQKLEDTNRNKQKALSDLSGGDAETQAQAKERFLHLQYSAALAEHTRAQQARADAAARMETARAKLKVADKLDVAPDNLTELLAKDPELASLRADLDKYARRRDHFGRTLSDTNRADYRAILGRVAALEQQVAARADAIKREHVDGKKARAKAELTAAVEQLTEEHSAHAEKERRARREVDELRGKIETAGGAKQAIDAGLIKNDIEERERDIDMLGRKIHALRIEVQSRPRVESIQPAAPPTKKELRKQIMLSVFAALGMYGLVAGLALVYESRRDRVFGSADLKARSGGVPVLGSVPAVAWTKAGGAKKEALYEEFNGAIDRVRATAFPGGPVLPGRAVLVTSADPREGKTILVSHLALSLVKADRKVLLIDLNLRNPELHRFLDQAEGAGAAELLRNEAVPQDVVRRTTVHGLYLVTAGKPCGEARDALCKDRLKRLLDKFRQEFDTILIDCPAVLAATDALLVAAHADAVLMTALRLASGHGRLEQARQMLAGVGADRVGLVLMGE